MTTIAELGIFLAREEAASAPALPRASSLPPAVADTGAASPAG